MIEVVLIGGWCAASVLVGLLIGAKLHALEVAEARLRREQRRLARGHRQAVAQLSQAVQDHDDEVRRLDERQRLEWHGVWY